MSRMENSVEMRWFPHGKNGSFEENEFVALTESPSLSKVEVMVNISFLLQDILKILEGESFQAMEQLVSHGSIGMKAKRDIKKNQIILVEKPFLRLTGDNTCNNRCFNCLYSIMETIGKGEEATEGLQMVMQLTPFRTADESLRARSYELLASTLYNNCFFSSEEGGCSDLYYHISFINHSCRPNCIMTNTPTKDAMVIYPIRDIKEGEEITISYSMAEVLHPGPEGYRPLLKERYFFDCNCGQCHNPMTVAEYKPSNSRTVGSFSHSVALTLERSAAKKCMNCSKGGCESRCSRCKKAYYCNSQCLSSNWPIHKNICKELRTSQQ